MSSEAISEASAAPVPQSPVARVLRPVRSRLLASALLSFLGSALNVIPLAAMALIAQRALTAGHGLFATTWVADSLWAVALAAVAALVAGLALVSAGELLAHLADNRLSRHLQTAMARHLTKVPLGWFTGRFSGEVKQAMQDDISTLHELSAHACTTGGRALGAVLASVLYLFLTDWRMALIALLPFPAFFLFFGRAVKRSAANMQAFGEGLGRINNAVVEFTRGIAAVKAFGHEGKTHRAYRDAVNGFARAFVDFTRPLVPAMANANAMIAPVAVLGVVFIAGAGFVAMGWMAPLEVLPFALVAPGISGPLLLLHYLMHDLHAATAAARRVLALLETPTLALHLPAVSSPPRNAELRFEGVGYRYDPALPMLEGIDLVLRPGSVTAIVGASGAGKSTLARLLLRFFDPSEGRITLGGVDLRQLNAAQLYRHIGFVLQDVQMVHASLRENIAMGRPDATNQEVQAAARAANIHERILRLPRGYDSVVGEDARLSGGEAQRVTIARALLLDAPVLVLDEATAAADAENELAIQSALARISVDRTLLVIAHRLETVMHANQIVVLHEGRIVEQGRHADLLAHGGRYATLWRLGSPAPAQETAVVPC